MKKLIIMCLLFALLFTLIGCNRETEKVNVDFRIADTSNIIQLDKGSVITADIVPIENASRRVELYYKAENSNLYLNEPITTDTVIYVSFLETDVNVFAPKQINKIEVQDNSSKTLEVIRDGNKIDYFIKCFDKLAFEEILKIAPSFSSIAVNYSEEYISFQNDIKSAHKVVVYYEDDTTSTFYIGTNNHVLYDTGSSTAYISIANRFNIEKILKGM